MDSGTGAPGRRSDDPDDCRAALILSALITGPARQKDTNVPELIDVFVAGDGGYHTYRIPSVILTSTGTLLAFAGGRRAGAGDAWDIDLVLRRSHDGGRSWAPMQIIGDNGPNTFGNPCAVVDARTNTIWLLTTQNRGTDREKDIIAGTSEASQPDGLGDALAGRRRHMVDAGRDHLERESL